MLCGSLFLSTENQNSVMFFLKVVLHAKYYTLTLLKCSEVFLHPPSTNWTPCSRHRRVSPPRYVNASQTGDRRQNRLHDSRLGADRSEVVFSVVHAFTLKNEKSVNSLFVPLTKTATSSVVIVVLANIFANKVIFILQVLSDDVYKIQKFQ